MIYVSLTSAASELLARLDLPLRELQDEVMRPLSKADRIQLIELLERLRGVATAT